MGLDTETLGVVQQGAGACIKVTQQLTTSTRPVIDVVSVAAGATVLQVKGAGTLVNLMNAAGVTQLKVDNSGNLTAAGALVTAGSNSAGSAPVLTPTLVSGTAAQLSDTTRDYMIYLQIGTAGTAMTVAIGPTSGVANTLITSAVATSGQLITFRLPAGWFMKWTATTATLANQAAVGC